MKVAAWIQAARPLAQVNLAVPLLVGECLAWFHTEAVDWTLVVLTHTAAIFDHLFIVFANDVADEAGDRGNRDATPFSGGSRVLVEAKLTSVALARASYAAAACVLAIAGVMAFALSRPLLLPGWLAGLALLWAYSFAPLRLSYRGWGEVLQGLGLGVVLPLIGFYTVAGSLGSMPWPALVPLFVLGVAGNITTALPDVLADEACRKRTWPVRFGSARARTHALQLMALAVFMTPLVLPSHPKTIWAAVETAPAVVLLWNARNWRSADPRDRGGRLRFVFLNGLALNLVMVGWCIALANPGATVDRTGSAAAARL